MINRDWERFGEEIRKTVQDAIDAQDFNRLNQTVSDTINSAVQGITKTIKSAGEAASSHRDVHPYERESHPYYQDTKPRREKPQTFYGSAYAYRRQEPVRGRLVELYRSVTAVRAGGIVMTAVGAWMGVSSFLFFLIMFLNVLFGGGFSIAEIIAAAVFFVVGAGSFALCRWGSVLRGRVKRFRSYIRILGNREYCNIRELAEGTHKNVKYVLRDLDYMLQKEWFLQGHMDEQKTCLIVSHDMYRQYLEIENSRKKSIEAQKTGELERERKIEKQSEKLSPEVRKVIEEGDAYIRKIHACNDAIPGVEISAKISRMETVIDRIFDRIEQNPEAVDDIRRMMDYYLPTTIKLLEAYKELDSQPVGGENISTSKAEIEKTLDTLSAAFEKLLDNLFQDTAWDVSSDISVLRTMLAQDGLTEDELRK